MIQGDLREEVLATLGMDQEAQDEQEAVLARVSDVAGSRLARLMPYLLTDGQLHTMYSLGVEDIIGWITAHVPNYRQLVRAIVLDVADEAADINRVHAVA